MKISELKNIALPYWPGVYIDRILNLKSGRGLLGILILGGTTVTGALSILFLLFEKLSTIDNFIGNTAENALFGFGGAVSITYGLFFIFASLELVIEAFLAFYRSYAFLDLESLGEDANFKKPLCSYEAASLLLRSEQNDPVVNILSTDVGEMAMYRLGVSLQDVFNFTKQRIGKIKMADVEIKSKDQFITFEQVASAILDFDKDLVIFLASRMVTKEDFVGAIGWCESMSNMSRKRMRWWSRELLGKIPSIGKNWAYGETPTLSRYAMPIERTPFYIGSLEEISIRKKEIEELEKVLSRMRGANALIVADTDEEAMRIVGALGKMIEDGTVMPSVENKLIYVLDYTTLFSTTKEKNVFEAKIYSALQESVRAGNIILVIKDLPALISAGMKIGSDVLNVFEWYLNSPAVHIIATTSNQGFHGVLESNTAFMRHFEKILVQGVNYNAVINYLKDQALVIEAESRVWFLYQAVREAAVSAERFFFGGEVEDKSVDLLIEAATSAKSTGVKVIKKEDIMSLVEAKTGIPRETSSLNNTDNKILLDLERMLSERVIGQEEGVKAIASAMRRARAGITNPNRPMGSFLFLGPTGVGKTETTKALASAFFGGESSIMRLDMSEYRTNDSLERLIGNFAIGKSGVLSTMLRDKPYGVLLLDEFEKGSRDIHDLFLQILDEGIFSDMSGKKVSARNLIIIATSNAGSEMIWKIVKSRGDGALNKDEVITSIINEGTFRPELLNRFDGTIIFHPLNRENLTRIAELMLRKLNKRLIEKGLEIEITPELINALIEKGTDPTFGARPMNRAIQDKVESMLADKILRGEASPGTKIVFTSEEIQSIRM
jgi:ATP-dependent Clp protease ATP-binding subunit ClpC